MHRLIVRGCLALVALALPLGAAAPAATAHGSVKHAAGLSDRQLSVIETRTLGAAHAADHARQRALQHDPRARATAARVLRSANRMRLRALATATPGQDGQWGAPEPIPVIGIHAAMLPTGKVLFFSRNGDDVQNGRAGVWDPVTKQAKLVPPPIVDGKAANIFCAGLSFLPDGRVLVMGGQLGPDPLKADPTQEFKGLNSVYTFNPFNETWTRQPNMRGGRWYPTQVLTPDGHTVVMSGYDASGVAKAPQNPDIEVFTPSADLDGVGTVTYLGHRGGVGEPPTGGLYPHLFTMPSGKVLAAGPRTTDSWFLDPVGGGVLSWSDAPDPATHPYGNGVILPNDTPGAATKVELIAGGNTASNLTEVFDEAHPSAGWTAAAPLVVPRSHMNTVLLPDSSMVAVGGGTGATPAGVKYNYVADDLTVELYDPATDTWRQGPMEAEPRAYHSTALLLPDARVVSAGDDTWGGNNADTAEIYSPPYLFRGARPAITSAPAAVAFGQSFQAGYTGSDVAKAVMVAPSAVTHADDMSQRFVPLTVTANAGGSVTLRAPASGSVAPPGYYMLFLLSADGVPSLAKFVKVGSGVIATGSAPQPQPGPVTPTAPAGTPIVPAGTQPVPAGTQPVPAGAQPVVTAPPAKPVGTTPPPAKLLGKLSLGHLTLRRVIAAGLRVRLSCARTCTARGAIRLDRRTAVRLGLVRRRTGSATVLIGRSSVKLLRGHAGTLTARLDGTVRTRLHSTAKVVVVLTVTATDASQNTGTTTRRVTLGR